MKIDVVVEESIKLKPSDSAALTSIESLFAGVVVFIPNLPAPVILNNVDVPALF